jgi:hypothetical protein
VENDFQMIDYIQEIKNLRSKLAGGLMSVLVGSGFSKNAHRSFPDWREMIFDMADELYGVEIGQHCPENISKEDLSKWVKDSIFHRIQREGYLQVVSAYIRLKGMEEAVVSYIEERTPIIQEGKEFYLLADGKKELLTQEHLKLHSLLVGLPWNNIYTTNYDPLLECSVDTGEFNELREENRMLYEQSYECSRKLYHLKIQRDALAKRNQFLRDQNQEKQKRGEGIDPMDEKRSFEEIVAIDNQSTYLQDLKKDADETIRINESYMQHSHTVVKSGSELSVKKNSNIIKLHGSLRSKEQREQYEFGFDEDPRKQYVISGEHYTNYPKKHEAFTQLMRISLLQESFCLVGFSGVDPNFLNWIDWVRDLLQKSRNTNEGKPEYKIYLIDLSDKDITAEQLLYFENHRIVRIPLLSKEVINFLESKSGRVMDSENIFASALEQFFNYLADHPAIIASAIRPTVNRPEKEWVRLWKSATRNGHSFQETEVDNLERFRAIDALFPELTFPRFSVTDYHLPLGFLIHLTAEAVDLMDNNRRDAVLRCALRVLEYYKVPIAFAISSEIIERLVAIPSTRAQALQLRYRNNTLTAPDTKEDTLDELPLNDYEQVLRCAFSLQYSALKNKLNEWTPPVEIMHLKSGFLCWFDPDAAESILEEQLKNRSIGEQQGLHSMEMLSAIKRAKVWQTDSRLEKKIEQYERAGYYSILDNFSFFEKHLLPKAVKAEAYGSDRYSGSTDESDEGGIRDVYARQSLSTLAETALPVYLLHMQIIGAQQWYRLFIKLFRDFTFPCVYYTLQYGDENLLRRAAQDICFAEDLPHGVIVERLFSAYESIPEGQRDNLLLFVSELLAVVEPQEWQNDFIVVWRSLKVKPMALTEKPAESFVNAGFRYIEDCSILFEIVDDLLHFLPAFLNSVITHLYYLNSNAKFRQRAKLSQTPKLESTIESIISFLPKMDGDYIFILGNLHFLLEEKHLNKISQVFKQLDLNWIKTAGAWRVLLHFVGKHDPIRELIKKTLTQHSTLWQTGIHGNSFHAHSGMLRISELTFSEAHPKGLTWSDDEIMVMYEKMKPALSDLTRFIDKDFSFVSFTNEWEQMAWFVDYFKNRLEKSEDYLAIREAVQAYLQKLRGYRNSEDGLLSDASSSELDALKGLSEEIEAGNADVQLVALQINKLRMRAGSCVEEGLEYLSRWLRDKRTNELFESMFPEIISLLRQYRERPLKNADQGFVERQLVIIALALADKNCSDNEISEWIRIAETSRFNATRQRFWLYNQNKDQQSELM